MEQYHAFLQHILDHGHRKEDRTGTGTLSLFGHQMRFDLQAGFPLVTTKKVFWKGVVVELLWFLKGGTNTDYLREHGVTIWDEWAAENGDLGPVYGKQWRAWTGPDGQAIDQIQRLVDGLRTNPDSRRHVVSAWNVGELSEMALPPCHAFFQFWVGPPAEEGGRRRLSCQLYQRSADAFLGVVFNVASYALLTHLVAQQADLDVGDFVWTGGDCHLYLNHLDQAREQLTREPLAPPTLRLARRPDRIDGYTPADIELVGYRHHAALPAPVAV